MPDIPSNTAPAALQDEEGRGKLSCMRGTNAKGQMRT
jgi:hypothetical protein